MTKLTVELPETDYQRLLNAAQKIGKSVQTLLHEWINQLPELEESFDVTQDPVFQMEGYDSDAPSDLSIHFDTYLYGDEYPTVRLSATQRLGHQQFKLELWNMLELVRVYTKPPGKKVDRSDPFVLSAGSTVLDLAERIHGDVADKLAYAKVWGGKIEGQKVSRDFEFRDRDIVELGT